MGPGKCEYVVADLGSKAGCDALSAEVKKRVSNSAVIRPLDADAVVNRQTRFMCLSTTLCVVCL